MGGWAECFVGIAGLMVQPTRYSRCHQNKNPRVSWPRGSKIGTRPPLPPRPTSGARGLSTFQQKCGINNPSLKAKHERIGQSEEKDAPLDQVGAELHKEVTGREIDW